MSNSPSHLETGVIIRRSLFFLILIILTLGNLFTLFNGLNAPQAMDQAQISREIARGNGFTTKFIRPIAYMQAQEGGRAVSLAGFEDSYHSPLAPLLNAAVLKLVGADDPEAWQIGDKELVFPLDRVIAAVGTLFFLMAIGVNYLLISRIFDAKIAGVCAILMLFCQMFWDYSLSGLPQMLMLLLFSCAIYFVYRAVENATEGKIAMMPAMIAGVFFTLLALTHWLTVWIALGYIIFAAIAFRPRGIVGISIIALILIAAAGPLVRNSGISDSPLGTAYLALYNSLGPGTEDSVMRSTEMADAPELVDGLIFKVVRSALLQITDIIPFLGGIVVAPLFFIALLHPFKRGSIAMFRWAILLMWVSAAFGLALFGITPGRLDSNQLHLLFAPIMTAYGVAFISILWSRLEFVAATPMLRNVHHVVVILICAMPLVLSLPQRVRIGMQLRDRGGYLNWPPYYPPGLANKAGLKAYATDKQVVFSDQPWAVAWYADRVSIWLPTDIKGFEKMENIAADLQMPAAGILITPSSHGMGPVRDVAARYGDFTSLVLDGRILTATSPGPEPLHIFMKDTKLQNIAKRYPYAIPLFPNDMMFFSERAPRGYAPSAN